MNIGGVKRYHWDPSQLLSLAVGSGHRTDSPQGNLNDFTCQSRKWEISLMIRDDNHYHAIQRDIRMNWGLLFRYVCNLYTHNESTSSNQIYLVTFMCLTVDTSFIFSKKSNVQNGFLISVTLRWHSGVKKHEIWTFKVNFLRQKTTESFSFFFIEEYQFRTTFFVKYMFW